MSNFKIERIMKLNFVKKAIAFAFALSLGYEAYLYQKPNVISSLAVENIEALAGGEGDSRGCCPSAGSTCSSGGIILIDYDFCSL